MSAVALQVDVLVRLISISENPQTFNQALLLIGNMARFASESIIHAVMPIFTFIDRNVMRRDDEFSFKVVQQVRFKCHRVRMKCHSVIDGVVLLWNVQAISNIVPVMVSHLKRNQSNGLELYLDAREFLSLFTDASRHVPSHRRNRSVAVLLLRIDMFLYRMGIQIYDPLHKYAWSGRVLGTCLHAAGRSEVIRSRLQPRASVEHIEASTRKRTASSEEAHLVLQL